jgi:hypothetical protein
MTLIKIYKLADEIAIEYGIYVSKSKDYLSLPPQYQKQVRERVYKQLANANID